MILVSGFQAFRGEKINPTEKLINELELMKKQSPDFGDFSTVVLPVTFAEAPRVLKNAIDKFKPKKVLMLGQAGGTKKIGLERVALNWQEARFPDENNYLPLPSRINESGVDAYFSNVDIGRLKQQLDVLHIPVEISFSAGAFVCNRIYYEFFQHCGPEASGLFVHFPFLDEQLVQNPGAESLSWEVQKQAFLAILKFFKN
ncbi:MAG: pyroglutamyl-peptidase I [Bdellovibrionota bacterium]